jgi:transposase-like protein
MTTFLDYRGYRLPPNIIAQALWFYHRFTLNLCDVEDRLAKRGVTAS